MLRVVTYHRIGRPEDSKLLDPALISATPEGFESQVRHLRSSYDVISINEVVDAVRGRTPLPRRPVLVTFDDAYSDFADIAWPILKHHRMPATLFVPTAYPGDVSASFWWDRLYRAVTHLRHAEISLPEIGKVSFNTPEEKRLGLKKLRAYVKTLHTKDAAAFMDSVTDQAPSAPKVVPSVLSWTRLRALAAEGVTLAAHTRTHPILPKLSAAELRTEILGSHEDLRKEIGWAPPAFCYPNGSVDGRVVQLLSESGFVLGFTTELGHNRLNQSDCLMLRRTDITLRTTPSIFKLRLLPIGNMIDRWRQP